MTHSSDPSMRHPDPEYRYVEGAEPTTIDVRYVAQRGGKVHKSGKCGHLEQAVLVFVCPPSEVAETIHQYADGWPGPTGPSTCRFCGGVEVPQ